MVTGYGLNRNMGRNKMTGNDDIYRELVKRDSELDNLKMLDADRYITITYDDRELSVNHLVWLQIMGLYETWDII